MSVIAVRLEESLLKAYLIITARDGCRHSVERVACGDEESEDVLNSLAK